MVELYQPVVPSGFEWAVPVVEADALVFRAPWTVADGWSPIEMRLLGTDSDDDVEEGDSELNPGERGPWRRAAMPWHSRNVLVLRDEAIDLVGPLLEPWGTLLPVRCSQAELRVFRAPTVDGVLDEERSTIKRFSSGAIMEVQRFVLRPDALAGRPVAQLGGMRVGPLLLTGELVRDMFATAATTGTGFELIHPAFPD